MWRCPSQVLCLLIISLSLVTSQLQECGKGLKYLMGDALMSTNCVGPEGKPYPTLEVSNLVRTIRSPRKGRSFDPPNPHEVQKRLLTTFEAANSLKAQGARTERSLFDNASYMGESPTRSRPITSRCSGDAGGRLCKTKYNTTAPLYGVSLTSGQPVTIVQKFPDLLQQVIFEVCESKECDILHGECVQTYVPYLFLVIPLGPVTLTGQDYVLVESGCVCKPKFGAQSNEPNIADALPGFV